MQRLRGRIAELEQTLKNYDFQLTHAHNRIRDLEKAQQPTVTDEQTIETWAVTQCAPGQFKIEINGHILDNAGVMSLLEKAKTF